MNRNRSRAEPNPARLNTHDRGLPPLIRHLLDSFEQSPEAKPIQLFETHISWVLLRGDLAYKIKKPVHFSFLDFSSLELRRHFCEEEIRLNRRYAPELYLGLTPVTGTTETPRLGGAGAAIEFAVTMRRFDTDQTFDHLLGRGRLTTALVESFAERLARFHACLDPLPVSENGPRPDPGHWMRQNFTEIASREVAPREREKINRLERWTLKQLATLQPVLEERLTAGWFRECHGDLHLGNIVVMEGRPVPFDGIEFNAELRWIDTLSELAFPVMDLEAQGATELAYPLLNHYLMITGDYDGLRLLDLYRLYRAMVRAKVCLLSPAPAKRGKAALNCHDRQFQCYLDYGLGLIKHDPPRLWLTHGVSGSGKSYWSHRLAGPLRAIVLRSDVERKRLAEACGHEGSAELYSPLMTKRTYQRLMSIAEQLIGLGFNVILDATFLLQEQRQAVFRLASRHHIDARILLCEASIDTLRSRVVQRVRGGQDPSDADLGVLESQLRQREPLSDEEQALALALPAGETLDFNGWVERVLG